LIFLDIKTSLSFYIRKTNRFRFKADNGTALFRMQVNNGAFYSIAIIPGPNTNELISDKPVIKTLFLSPQK
jgi:hypothetical protein